MPFIFAKNALSFSNHCLKVMCSDAAHVKWGSCTLYSVNGVSSNYNAVSLCQAIIAGNENEMGCKLVFDFLMNNFPNLNHQEYTMITDRDKGLNSAMALSRLKIRSFFCTFHRADNIKKGTNAIQLDTFGKW